MDDTDHSDDDADARPAGPRPRRAKAPPPAAGPEALQAAVDTCLRLLRVRARSSQELQLALGRRGYSAQTQGEALERLRGWGYLDDARFARERATSLLSRGRLGPRAVLQRLEAQGVDAEAARAALGEAREAVAFEPLQAARHLLQKRGLLDPGRPLDARGRARAARLLHGRGFSEDVIAALLGQGALDPLGSDD